MPNPDSPVPILLGPALDAWLAEMIVYFESLPPRQPEEMEIEPVSGERYLTPAESAAGFRKIIGRKAPHTAMSDACDVLSCAEMKPDEGQL
jgi:uncharacterized protein YbjT (DUF2867 family)